MVANTSITIFLSKFNVIYIIIFCNLNNSDRKNFLIEYTITLSNIIISIIFDAFTQKQ